MNNNIFISQYFKTIFDRNAIDSFRPRYTNAHVILEEMIDVCELIEDGIISSKTLNSLKKETIKVIKNDVILNEEECRKQTKIFLNLLGTDNLKNEGVNHIMQNLKVELKWVRENYLRKIIQKLLFISDKRFKNYVPEQEIRSLINSFISECIFTGVSFKSLKSLNSLKKDYSKSDLRESIDRILNKKTFDLYLLLLNSNEDISNLFKKIFSSEKINIDAFPNFPIDKKYVPAEFKKIVNKRGGYIILRIKKGKYFDQYSGLMSLRTTLEELVNLAHIYYPNLALKFYNKGLIFDYSLREYRSADYINTVNYINILSGNLEKKIKKCAVLPAEVFKKISSSASYLNVSLNEFQVISRYLNAWIAIEVLFNTLKKESGEQFVGTTDYINKFVPKILSVFYIQKIINYLFQRIVSTNIDLIEEFKKNGVPDITEFVNFILIKKNRDALLTSIVIFPELHMSVAMYFDSIFDNKKLSDLILLHEENISAHIERLYRFRNVLIHGGEKSIADSGLYNISSILMLSINCQEYATQLIDSIPEILGAIEVSNPRRPHAMINIYNMYVIIYRIIIQKLQMNDFDDQDLSYLLLSPVKLLS